MSPELRRGAAFSAALHIVLGIVLLVVITPSLPPEASEGLTVTMEFAPGASGAAGKPSPKKPASLHPAKAPTLVKRPAPPAATPYVPPPPPPPPPPARVAEKQPPAPPKPTPHPPVKPSIKPAPTDVAPTEAPREPVPPLAKPLPKPPPPAPPVPRSAVHAPPAAKTSASRSPTHQPKATKNPAASSQALENTLEKLRALEEKKGTKLASAEQAGPEAAVATKAGHGISQGDTSALSASERGAIGAYVRRCWTYDAGAKGASHFQVLLDVVTDAAGTVRIAKVAPADQARVDAAPELRAFAERAVNAVLDPRCATLPLPPKMLGASRRLVFRFSP